MGRFHWTVGIGSTLLNELEVGIGEEGGVESSRYYITPDEARKMADTLRTMADVVERAHRASACTNCGDE